MSGYVRALLYMAAAGALSFVGMEIARQLQSRYATDVELRVRSVLADLARDRHIDQTVRAETPYMHFAVYELLEGLDHDTE